MYNALNRNSIDTVTSSAPADPGEPRTNFLLLSTSLLVDRVLLYTDLVDTLRASGEVSVWASSFAEHDSNWRSVKAEVETFPQVRSFREIPYNDLRRFNEFVWDYRYMPPSRMSMMEHVRGRHLRFRHKMLKAAARLFATMPTERLVESGVEKLLLSYPRSSEAEQRLQAQRPDVILSTGPFQFEQPGVFSTAKKLGIPTLAYVPSWDNISTKNRMLFDYDGYIVWNEQGREELHDFYPQARRRPVYVVGAPQFDIFYQERFFQSREEFCSGQSLDPELPIVVYAIGSPNFLQESHGAVHFARRVADGHLGDVQLLVRPHPIHDNAEMRELFTHLGPRIRLQETPNAGKELNKRTQDELQILEWVNTFRHADVVINLSSTVTIDAAIFDKPIVNLDFDPQPGSRDQRLVKDINHLWKHFKPIAESGGVWLVDDFDEIETAVKAYIKTPGLHREQRRWIVEHVCGYADGTCGERLAAAIIDFSKRSSKAK
jgi:hypothetical protein